MSDHGYYYALAHGEMMPTHAELAQQIIDRIEESNQPNPDGIAMAQVHALLAIAEEQAEANRIARESRDG